jgi:hypothetical protein
MNGGLLGSQQPTIWRIRVPPKATIAKAPAIVRRESISREFVGWL